jgi:ribosome biogenesis GTPase
VLLARGAGVPKLPTILIAQTRARPIAEGRPPSGGPSDTSRLRASADRRTVRFALREAHAASVAFDARRSHAKVQTQMIEIDRERLRSLGLTPEGAARAAAMTSPQGAILRLVRISEVHRETVTCHDGAQAFAARVLPRLVRELAEQGTALAVGDWAGWFDDGRGGRWIGARAEPLTHIARRDADGQRHPVVSNVDTALLVMGLDDDFNPLRLERYLALALASGVTPVVVLTKADVLVAQGGSIGERIEALRGRVPETIAIVAVDATAAAAAATLRRWLGVAQTLVLLGSSGAGKSTLTNTLVGRALQDTGAVRESDGRGMHTTTARALHCLPGGACVIDTPGVRTLRPDADAATLAATFDDVAALALRCRFRDCQHAEEPGCAVRDGVAADRLTNYRKLLRESRRDTSSVLDRQRQLATWKARARATRARLKTERGED